MSGSNGDADDAAQEKSDPLRTDRRGFFRGSALAAVGVAAGAALGFGANAATSRTTDDRTAVPGERPEGTGFDHLVVLMFENRSFDNLLGYLYASPASSTTSEPVPTGQTFEGLNTGTYSNAAPDGERVEAHPYEGPTDSVMMSPQPDPGEEYPFVNTQLFNTVDPSHNTHHELDRLRAPFNAPAAGTPPTMDGFLRDYVLKWMGEHGGKEPTPDEYQVIMGSFVPEMLPVFSTLARNFAIYDHWHCAVPSQTFCNRSFFHASTSHGFVTNGGNGGYGKWITQSTRTGTTIFNRLEEAGIEWAVYYDDRQLISMTGLIHAPHLEPYFSTRFRTMSHFYRDVAEGTLPAYSFVEPRMLYDHNDMHPPVGPMEAVDVDGKPIVSGAISDVRAGDALLHDIYTAIKNSATSGGSNALNTVLAVTFDEHGGTFDHVAPPSATPPHKASDKATDKATDKPTDKATDTSSAHKTEMDFAFDRLGVRVPAMVISAYTPQGVVLNDPMHHAAVIATLCERWGLAPLTARDDGAPTLSNAITLTAPRHPSTWPTTHPHYVPKNPESDSPIHHGDDDRPLSPPGVGLMGLLLAKYGSVGDDAPRTYREAWALVQKHALGLFGK
jgi:phospholipase C